MDPIPSPAADPAPDHAVLVANAALSQAASPTAMLAQRLIRQRRQRFDRALLLRKDPGGGALRGRLSLGSPIGAWARIARRRRL